jgi:hypothetical protein
MAQINPYLYELDDCKRGLILDVREVRYCRETGNGVWVAVVSDGTPEHGFMLGLYNEDSHKRALEIMVMKSALGGN